MSAWTDAGFPSGFRFRNPRDVFYTLCCAMDERSVNSDQLDTDDFNILYRQESYGVKYPPQRLEEKHKWIPGSILSDTGIFEFMRDRIMYIASCYCDPDKAYDFDNYPELENWTPESLEDKLKEHYIKFSPFCDKEKYLMFLYHVLNLCTVRRVPVCDEYGTARRRSSGDVRFQYDYLAGVKEAMTETDFVPGSNPAHEFTVRCDDFSYYSMEQCGVRFSTWLDDARMCDIVFYGFAGDDFDDFSFPETMNIRKNSWFCAGAPDLTEKRGNSLRAVLEMPAPDVDVRSIPELKRNQVWRSGFALKYFINRSYNSCFGYAVRDQRKYLKYFER